jgi:hypothetical protein
MSGKQVIFFAVYRDIQPIMKKIEDAFEVQYYKAGLFDNPNISHYTSYQDFPDMGFTSFGDWNWIDRYLVIPKNLSLNIREVPQRSGGLKYAVDPQVNEKSVELKIGGIYRSHDSMIIAGRIATGYENEFSTTLVKTFSSHLKKEFRYIDKFYVGKEAFEKLKQGWRLVTIEGLPGLKIG